jgi:peroxin-3
MTQHVLTQGGFPSDPSFLTSPIEQDERFWKLLEEARCLILSANFSRVLEACLDSATDMLLLGLEKSTFTSVDRPNEDIEVRLAAILPSLANWSQLALISVPNDLVKVTASISLFTPSDLSYGLDSSLI